MATSAETYTAALVYLSKTYDFDVKVAMTELASKGLLPAKMLKVAKPKPADTPFASKAAGEFAALHGIAIKGLVGTSVKDKLTVKDLKDAMKPTKVNIHHVALKYAQAHGLDISVLNLDRKILLADVKAMETPDTDTESVADEPVYKVSPSARSAMTKWDIEDSELADIQPTGKRGMYKLCDLKSLIDECKAAE